MSSASAARSASSRSGGPDRPGGRPGADRGLAELAARAGYADQAHLGHDCRALAGATPTELAPVVAAYRELYLAPDAPKGTFAHC